MEELATWWKRSAAVLCVVMLGGLAGCGGPRSVPIGGVVAGTTVRITLANHVWTETIKELLPEFERSTGARVEVTQLAEDQLSDQYNVRLNAGSDEIDVLMYRPLQENLLFADNGYLADLTAVVNQDAEWDWDDFQSGPASLTQFEDKIYGVPLITERAVLYYRKDLLAAAGLKVPSTLEELDAAAAAIHQRNPAVAGYIGRTGRSAGVTQFSSFLNSFGGSFNDGETSQLSSPQAREAYQFYGNLIRRHTQATINPEMSWSESFAVFQQGQAAFIADADSLYRNMIDPAKSKVAEQVGFAPFPAGPAGAKPYNIAAWGLAVNGSSRNQAGAWAFIRWATSQAISLRTAKSGVFGARQSVWDNQEATAMSPPQLLEAIRTNTENGVPADRPRVFEVARAREIVGLPMAVAIAGGDVDAAIEQADREFAEFLVEDAE